MRNLVKIGRKIASTYFIHSSVDVPRVVADYIYDTNEDVSLEDFNRLCYDTALAAEVMRPLIKDVREAYASLISGAA